MIHLIICLTGNTICLELQRSILVYSVMFLIFLLKILTYVDHAVNHLVPVAEVRGVEEGVLQHLIDVSAFVVQAHGAEIYSVCLLLWTCLLQCMRSVNQ